MDRRTLPACLTLFVLFGCAVTRPKPPPQSEILKVGWNIDTCPVHNVKLIEAVEPLSIGKRCMIDSEYASTRKTSFPYAMTDMGHDGNEYYWVAHYCPKCREAEKEWGRLNHCRLTPDIATLRTPAGAEVLVFSNGLLGGRFR